MKNAFSHSALLHTYRNTLLLYNNTTLDIQTVDVFYTLLVFLFSFICKFYCLSIYWYSVFLCFLLFLFVVLLFFLLYFFLTLSRVLPIFGTLFLFLLMCKPLAPSSSFSANCDLIFCEVSHFWIYYFLLFCEFVKQQYSAC